MSDQFHLKAEQLVKVFPGVRAVDGVDFDLLPGEVHLLLGENGAGKSTLIKCLCGALRPDSGRLQVAGREVHFRSTSEAHAAGVATVFQEFNLIPVLNVAQNIFLGREPQYGGSPFINEQEMHRAAHEVLNVLSLPIDTHAIVENLGVAQKQMIEIARALSHNARVLIMDEPTAALTNQEIEQLFVQIAKLKARGVGIIYISHRMEEVMRLGDRVTVMRDGKKIGTWKIDEVDLPFLIHAMVARDISQLYPRTFNEPGPVALRVTGLSRGDKVKDINLHVRFGEIVGLAGLVGSGRTELVRAIFGADRVDAGQLEVDGQTINLGQAEPSGVIKHGIAMLPESRKEDGLALRSPISDNIAVASLSKLFPRGLVSGKVLRDTANHYIDTLRIACRNESQLASALSGGTQQRVVLAKWLCSQAHILLFDEPTRGIDVGSKAEIHALMDDLVRQGAAVIMVSSELPEVIGMSDRIYVMREGELVGEYDRTIATQETLLSAMVGVSHATKLN